MKKTSIAVIVIIVIITITLSLLSVAGMIGYTLFKNQEEPLLRTLNLFLAEQASTGLELPLWNLDMAQIVQTAESVMKERSVYAVVVREALSEKIIQAFVRDHEWKAIKTDSDISSSGLLSQETNIVYSQEIIGRVQVFITPKFMEERLIKIRIAIISFILIVAIFLIIALYFLLWRIVINPLKLLEHYAIGVNEGTVDNSSVRSIPVYGELGSLRSSVFKMVELLEIRYAELQQEARRFSESEKRFRTLVDTIPDLIWLKDPDGVYLSCNPMFERLFGAREADIIGKTDYNFVDQEQADFFREHDRKAIAAGKPSSNEEWVTFADDGHRALLDIIKTPMFGADGNLLGVLGVGRDITERKRAEEKLRESEHCYRTLFESSNDAIFIMENEKIVDCNMATYKLFGCSKQEIIGHSVYEFSPERQAAGRDSKEKASELIKAVLEGKPQLFEWVHRRLDGTPFFAEVNFNTLDIGRDVHLLAIVRDITLRKNAEKSLLASEFRFRSFYESNPEGVILMDFDGKITGANKSIAKMGGFSVQEIVNRHFKEFVPTGYHDIAQGVFSAIKTGITQDEPAEMFYLRKDGSELPIAIKGWRITDENSNPVSLGIFVRDLTIEKHLAEEKAAIERQLQQTQKMEAIGTLAGGIAHDFNNILVGILGYTELAMTKEGTPLDEKKVVYLNRVLSAGKRAKDLVQQILRFSRHESSTMIPIGITPIIKESVKLLRSTFPATIEIQQNIQAHYDMIIGDPTQVHQVMMNLCTNAYHAMRERGGILTISIENVVLQTPREFMTLKVPPGDYIQLGISDTGQGIAPPILERIFEPYFTTKKVNEGTGLGLSVIMGIIKSHNGLITVESELDKGTRFNVYFPVIQTITPGAAAPVQIAPTGNQERILLVDDEPFFLDVVKENLEALKYQVIANCSSLKTLEIFKDNPTGFDLVIMDQTMPEMTGLQLVAEIRKFNSDIPIILCTGYSEMVSEQSAKYYDITKFLLKPIIAHDLALAVQKALQRKG